MRVQHVENGFADVDVGVDQGGDRYLASVLILFRSRDHVRRAEVRVQVVGVVLRVLRPRLPVGVEESEVAAGDFVRLGHEGGAGAGAAGLWVLVGVGRILRQDATALGQRQRGERQGGQRDGSAPELQPLRSRDSGTAHGPSPCRWLSDKQRGDRVPQTAVEL